MTNKLIACTLLVFLLAALSYLVATKSRGIIDSLLWHSPGKTCLFLDFWCANKGKDTEIVFGAYDPENTLTTSPRISADHFYYSWVGFDASYFQSEVQSSLRNNRSVFVSIEPWPENTMGEETLLVDIGEGTYDRHMREICVEIEKVPRTVLVSFGHEMDHDFVERYPWSGKDENIFINAYRRFVDECRFVTDNAEYVWSPVGDKKALLYWPGEAYVDYVGFPVYSFPDFDVLYYGKARSFSEATREKYDRLSSFGKPLMVTELGVAGDRTRKIEWLSDMNRTIGLFKNITSVFFFNAEDTEGVWGNNLPAPDWRLDESMIP